MKILCHEHDNVKFSLCQNLTYMCKIYGVLDDILDIPMKMAQMSFKNLSKRRVFCAHLCRACDIFGDILRHVFETSYSDILDIPMKIV